MNGFATLVLAACLAVPETPAIAIIIDDLGNRADGDFAATALPGPIAVAILPFTPHARELAVSATASGKEVLLHLPMEAESGNHLLGPGALDSSMTHADFVTTLREAMHDVPHLSGVNNHMGSLLTRDLERMRWLMTELGTYDDLIYVDSRTTSGTVARKAAAEARVRYIARDVFLDNERDSAYINAQLDALISHAIERGSGIGIAHPHPETLTVLLERLTTLRHVRLVSLAELQSERACRAPVQSRLTR